MKRFWKWLCKTKTRTLTLFFSLTVMFGFIIVVLIISNNGGTVPDSLIYCTFGALSIAVIMSGAITIKKIKIGEIEFDTEKEGDSDDI